MDKINEFLKENCIVNSELGYVEPTEWITCKDGFTVSVQASKNYYCTPRLDKAWPYSNVELGFPSEASLLLQPYAEDPDRPTDTVYGYVPIEIVNQLIDEHGGIK